MSCSEAPPAASPPVVISLETMAAGELSAYARALRQRRVADAILSGLLSMMQAEGFCDKWLTGLGSDPHHRLHHIVAATAGGRQRVGTLWFTEIDCAGPTALIQDLYIDEAQRGRGYGRAALAELEVHAARLGLSKLQARVFAHQQSALTMLERLAFAHRQLVLDKRLPRSPAPGR